MNTSQAKIMNRNVACLAHHVMNDCERCLIAVKQAVRRQANQMQLRPQNVKDAVMFSAIPQLFLHKWLGVCIDQIRMLLQQFS
jgi:hypothetical protein